MIKFIIRRIIIFIPLMLILSVVSYTIIELPPGDFLSIRIAQLQQEAGNFIAEEEIARLRIEYGLDKPVYMRYFMWLGKILFHGDFGRSFQWNEPVVELVRERVALTIVISLLSIIFGWIVAIPISIYSATHQYSPFDYGFTFMGFIGLAIPNFLFALVAIWIAFAYFGFSAIGLFSPEFAEAPWNLAKVLDMLKHVWIPMIIIGTAGTAGLIRILRACLLDELEKQYVITARAKGVSEIKLLFKYPVRTALNPLVSTFGWMLPRLISGEVLTAMVLNIPTTGPLLLQSLLSQDMYLAGSIIMMLSALTVIGTLVSDILLVWVDPRIRYKGVSKK